MAVHTLLVIAHDAKAKGIPLQLPRTGTAVDQLIEELKAFTTADLMPPSSRRNESHLQSEGPRPSIFGYQPHQ